MTHRPEPQLWQPPERPVNPTSNQGPTTWRELPRVRKLIVIGSVAAGLTIAAVTVAGGEQAMASSSRVFVVLGWGLGSLLSAICAIVGVLEKRPKYLVSQLDFYALQIEPDRICSWTGRVMARKSSKFVIRNCGSGARHAQTVVRRDPATEPPRRALRPRPAPRAS